MTSNGVGFTDAELAGIERALKRAARSARRLSRQTGTPFYVWRDGMIVDLNERRPRAAEASEPYTPEPRA